MGIQDVGNNVRRAMKIRKLSIAKLSSEMGIGSATLSNILNGRSTPKSTTLIKIAEALEVDLNELLADSYELNTLRFRTQTLSGREKAERDQTEIETAVWLGNYKYLEDSLEDHLAYSLDSIGTSNPEAAAIEVREILGIEANQPITDITKHIESAGIKLRVHQFGFKKTNGLSIGKQNGGPAIVVNSDAGIPVERQIFTVAHELGHLTLHNDSYDLDLKEENNDEEKEANEFAGSFLVPTESFIKEWNDTKGLDFVDSVLRTKSIFRVSYKTVLRRLVQINKNLSLGDLSRTFAIQYKKQYHHDLKNHYEPNAISRFDLIEDRYARLVRQAYDKKLISLARAGEMLSLSPEDMRTRQKAWKEQIELDE